MATLNITHTATGNPAAIVEVWQRGSGSQADARVAAQLLAGGDTATGPTVSGTQYLVVHEATDSAAKTIDNWSQTPPSNNG